MKIIKILVVLICISNPSNAQRRTIVVPAPQPPDVPIDGGIVALLIGGGVYGRKLINKP